MAKLLVPAGVAQSVEATPSSRRPQSSTPRRRARAAHPHGPVLARPPAPAFSASKVGQPAGGDIEGGESSKAVGAPLERSSSGAQQPTSNGKAVGARARACSTRDRAQVSTKVRAAIAVQAALGNGGGGSAIVEACPWLAGVPIDIVAREALRVYRPECSLAISPQWQGRLESAARQLERHGNHGAGAPGFAVAFVIDCAAGDWREWLPTPPRSLGAIAVCARRLAHKWTGHQRARARRAAHA